MGLNTIQLPTEFFRAVPAIIHFDDPVADWNKPQMQQSTVTVKCSQTVPTSSYVNIVCGRASGSGKRSRISFKVNTNCSLPRSAMYPNLSTIVFSCSPCSIPETAAEAERLAVLKDGENGDCYSGLIGRITIGSITPATN